MRRVASIPLYWRVCLTNGLVFVLGTLVLAFSPATVSQRVLVSEAVVLAVGLAVIMTLNAVLLRSLLSPLDRLTKVMETIDLGAAPGRRLDHPGHGPAAALGHGFNAMLERLEDERNLSTSRALAAQEEERRRIAQELHDEVGQSLTAVLLGLKSVLDQAPAQTAVQLEPVQATARASLEEVRRIAQRLRPGVLEDLGLLNSLSSLASDLTQHSQVSVTRGFAPGLPSLPRETELVLYRVAQEALTNVARHAGASHVELGVSRQGSAVVLRVADDGRGIRAPEGAGIQGMRERARMVGGRLDIHGRAGGGTEVTLVVPAASADVDGHPAGATA